MCSYCVINLSDLMNYSGVIQIKVLTTLQSKFQVFYGKNWKSKLYNQEKY